MLKSYIQNVCLVVLEKYFKDRQHSIDKAVDKRVELRLSEMFDSLTIDAPKIEMLSENLGREINVWTAINSFPLLSIHFHVEYTDIEEHVKYLKFNDFPELLQYFESFEPKHEYFKGCHFGVTYQHSKYGKLKATEVLVNTMDEKIIHVDELQKIFAKIKTFVKERPELLI